MLKERKLLKYMRNQEKGTSFYLLNNYSNEVYNYTPMPNEPFEFVYTCANDLNMTSDDLVSLLNKMVYERLIYKHEVLEHTIFPIYAYYLTYKGLTKFIF